MAKKGAVLSQLPQEAAITSTVATKHLGVAANAPYDEREDRGQPTTTNKYTGKQKVSKVLLQSLVAQADSERLGLTQRAREKKNR